MDESTTPRPARRRGLGPALTTFLVVDVLLVLALLVALAAFLSGGRDPEGTDRGASSAPTQSGGTASPGSDAAISGAFALPSGNIACEITGDAATCTVADSTAEPVPLEDCAGTAGQVLTVTADGASTPCVQGALPGPAAPGTPVLEYGESTTSGDFTCDSATSGVTCRYDPTGAGFTLARAGHQILEPTG
jgi:hypothetical protein